MKKVVLFLIIGFCTTIATQAQDYLGYVNSNYSGITGAIINPANIVDNRMRVDIALGGLGFNFGNTYLGVKRDLIRNLTTEITLKDIQKEYVTQVLNGKDKSFIFTNRVSLPSFMFGIGKKDAVGLTISRRNYISLDGVSEPLAQLLYSDVGRNTSYDVSNLLGVNIKNKNFSLNGMAWMEYGITYAHVFLNEGKHFIKAGVTPKLLQGLGSGYLKVENLELRFDNDPIKVLNDSLQFVSIIKTDVQYSHSSNYDTYVNRQGLDYTFNYLGVGLDAGIVYEYRPKHNEFLYSMDGKTDLQRRDKDKYLFKLGLSLVDLGSIKYDRGKYSSDFTLEVKSFQYRLTGIASLPVLDFDKIVDSVAVQNPMSATYRMNTPAALSFQADYNLYKRFYLNFTPYWAFQFKKRDSKVHDITVLSLTPRYDGKWFGFGIPVSYNAFMAKAQQPVKAGVSLRVGPLIFGTNDLISYLGGDFFGTNFYFLLKLPIPYGPPRDRDDDGVSNRKDKCKDVKGTWEFSGCPDRDFDHVADIFDLCPDVQGLPKYAGCPDSDGDSIPDRDDECIHEKGLPFFKGCPDSDNDSIRDKEDECPYAEGSKELKGCPDGDADGVADRDDACPTIWGLIHLKGCPDKDLDSIPDADDACPEQAGPASNHGCPMTDTDGDGVIDNLDDCPKVAGIPENKGCPAVSILNSPTTQTVEMAVEEKKIIEKAFNSLEFATAKDLIKATSNKGLDELAQLMAAHKKDWKIKLIGHTDNEGKAEKNMALSEMRAKAVKAYLISKGVLEEQIITEWYGATKPIADNKTPAGRQKNRRVEMKIVLVE